MERSQGGLLEIGSISTRTSFRAPSAGSSAFDATGQSAERNSLQDEQLRRKSILDQVESGEITALEACRRLGMARSWFYELIQRYKSEGDGGLQPRPLRRVREERRLDLSVVDAIIAHALRHPRDGERAIARALASADNGALRVSHASVGAVLRRNGLSRPAERLAASRAHSSPRHGARQLRIVRLDEATIEVVVKDATEEELIAEAIKGDIESFARVFERYRREVYTVCLKHLREHTQAEDLVQETFLRAFGSIKLYDGGRRLLPWLISIAKNLCIDVQRRSSRMTTKDPTDDFWFLEAREATPLDESIAKERRDRIGAALEQLSGHQRRALLLYALEGWSYADIARAEGKSVVAIKSLLFRARSNVKRLCGEGWLAGVLLPLRRLRTAFYTRAGNLQAESAITVGANNIAACVIALMMFAGGAPGTITSPARLPGSMALRAPGSHGAGSAPSSTRAQAALDVPRSGTSSIDNRDTIQAAPDTLRKASSPHYGTATPEQSEIHSIAVSPRFDKDQTLYATGNGMCADYPTCKNTMLFRSLDGGSSWQPLPANGMVSGGSILLAPGYGAGDSRIFAIGPGMQVSNDGGNTFTQLIASNSNQMGSASISPLFESIERTILIGGTQMTSYDDDLKVARPSRSVLDDASHPAFSPYYADDGLTLIGGLTQNFGKGTNNTFIYRCILDQCAKSDLGGWDGEAPNIRFPSSYPRTPAIFAFAHQGLLRSIDEGKHFVPQPTPWHDEIQDLAVSDDGARLVAAVHNGVYVSNDGGAHWRWTRTPLLADVQVLQLIGDRIVAGTFHGLACSTDGGTTWARRCAP